MSISLNPEETNKIINSFIPINTTEQYLEKNRQKITKIFKIRKNIISPKRNRKSSTKIRKSFRNSIKNNSKIYKSSKIKCRYIISK